MKPLRLLAAALALGAGALTHAAAPAGYAVPMGGAVRNDNDAIWSRLVQLAGGRGARFVVFATAAGDPQDAAAHAVATLQRYGAVATHIPVAPQLAGLDVAHEVRNPKWSEEVRRARGVYFTGGSQDRIVETFQPRGKRTPLLEAIWDVYRKGGVVAGSSAGAAIMSATMFRDAPDVVGVLRGTLREGQEIDRGLGFVGPALFVDQHFLARGRIGRMLPAMVAKGYVLGLGVEEDSAAIVHGDVVEVIGSKGALLVDLREASSGAGDAFAMTGARLTYLDRGDRIELATRKLIPSTEKSKQPIDPRAAEFEPYYEDAPFFMQMLGQGALLTAMTQLLDSKQSEVRGLAYDLPRTAGAARPDLGFEFRLYKGADTMGWFTSAYGGEDYTVANVYLDVTPVRVASPLYEPWRGAGSFPAGQP